MRGFCEELEKATESADRLGIPIAILWDAPENRPKGRLTSVTTLKRILSMAVPAVFRNPALNKRRRQQHRRRRSPERQQRRYQEKGTSLLSKRTL